MASEWNADEIVARVQRGATLGVARAIGTVERRAIELVTTGSKTGRVYRRNGVEHQSSAPGEPFASDTGDTIKNRRIEISDGGLRALLIFSDRKAPWLEFGTRKMAPRPFARRALLESSEQVIKQITDAIVVEMRK